MSTKTTTPAPTRRRVKPPQRPRPDYDQYLAAFRTSVLTRLGSEPRPVFTTSADGLWDTYLRALPPAQRAHHDCNACRYFVEEYGGLVVLDADGSQVSLFWGPAKGVYAKAHEACRVRVEKKAAIDGVFVTAKKVWGDPVTIPGPSSKYEGDRWHHLALVPPSWAAAWTDRLRTPGQRMAELQEDRAVLCRAIDEYPLDLVRRAMTIIDTDALYRSEKVRGPVAWLLDLQERLAATRIGQRRRNLVWQSVATAPAGWAHIRNTVAGTLLQDLHAGLPFEEVKRRFAEKMHPLQYQRPTAPPAPQTIRRAEEVVERLGIARSLQRRYATLEDIRAAGLMLWTPSRGKTSHRGLFAHLYQDRPTEIDGVEPITWMKFARTVMPSAQVIEYLVPHGQVPFVALTTAVHADAPPILQWDRPDMRNPIAWYLYAGGSGATQWGLAPHQWVPVSMVSGLPAVGSEHHGQGVMLLLAGCRDSRHASAGAALFPETMRSELREVRAVIEAHSASGQLTGFFESNACGIDLRKGHTWNAKVRVISAGIVRHFNLERWD